MAKYQNIADSFDGGLNEKAQDVNVPLNQICGAENVVFDDYGAVNVRAGEAQLNTVSLGSFRVDGIYSYRPSTMSAQLVAVCNGRAVVATGAATAFVEIASSVTVWTADTPCEMQQQNELLFFSNGNVKPYKFNGKEFTQMGVSAPISDLTAATNAAGGNLTGSYVYVYSGLNSYLAEGDYSGATVAFTAAGESVVVSNIETAPISAGVEYHKIYRNTAGQAGAYWYLTDVTNGVSSFTDNIADTALVTRAPTDNGSPRFFKFMLPSSGRMFAAGDSTKDYLWYSDINQPEVFPSSNFLRIGRGDGLDISGIKEQEGNLVISKSDGAGQTAIYILQMGDPTSNSSAENWYLRKMADNVGSESHRAMIDYDGNLTMFNRDGVTSFRGGAVSINPSESLAGSSGQKSISDMIENRFRNLDTDLVKNVCGINWNNRVYFSVPLGAVSDKEFTLQFIFDYVRLNKSRSVGGAWSLAGSDIGMQVSQYVTHESKLYGASWLKDGLIHQLDVGTAWKGSGEPQFLTAPFQGKKGHEQNWKDFRWAYVTCDTAAYSIAVKIYVDSKLIETISLDLTAVDLEATKTVKMRLSKYQGRYIQYTFKTTDTALPFTIRRIDTIYNLRGLRN